MSSLSSRHASARTSVSRFTLMTWPTTSQSSSMRRAAKCCLTEGHPHSFFADLGESAAINRRAWLVTDSTQFHRNKNHYLAVSSRDHSACVELGAPAQANCPDGFPYARALCPTFG